MFQETGEISGNTFLLQPTPTSPTPKCWGNRCHGNPVFLLMYGCGSGIPGDSEASCASVLLQSSLSSQISPSELTENYRSMNCFGLFKAQELKSRNINILYEYDTIKNTVPLYYCFIYIHIHIHIYICIYTYMWRTVYMVNICCWVSA